MTAGASGTRLVAPKVLSFCSGLGASGHTLLPTSSPLSSSAHRSNETLQAASSISNVASRRTTMAPLRRYLRISKYSVVECRIYLENPSDSRWLIDSRDPGLPRVFAAIKHLVVPKLREERERLRAKKKSKPVKDVITGGMSMLIDIYAYENGPSN